MEILKKYFEFTPEQEEKFGKLMEIYREWNEKINVISRKDFDFFYERHVLHSLAIKKLINFTPDTAILDAGCGGGFPGIPLAIMFPEVRFHLVDSIAKKITVVKGVAEELELKNVTAEQARVEKLNYSYDFVISRAVTALPAFVNLVHNKIHRDHQNRLKNGILYLKGGDFQDELKEIKRFKHKIYDISRYFDEEFFETKKIVYLKR